MDFFRFLSESTKRVDLLPNYSSNPTYNPLHLAKKPEKVRTITYENSLRELPHTPGDNLLLSDICPLFYEHFCGGLHIPVQYNTHVKGRPALMSMEKIAWPCGLESIIVNGEILNGECFVKCKCGNFYPTCITGKSSFFIVTCCSLDTPSIKVGKITSSKCGNCKKELRYYEPGACFTSDSNCNSSTLRCVQCTPFRELACDVMRNKRVTFNTPNYACMQENYKWKRNSENKCEQAFRTLNSPATLMVMTVHKRHQRTESYTLQEMLHSVSRSHCTDLQIIPITRTRVMLKDEYRTRVMEFTDNRHLYTQILDTLTAWNLL